MPAALQIQLVPGASPAEERVSLTHPDGRRETVLLHDYERVYTVPGLYEDVVQRRLQCASPARTAGELLRESAAAAVPPSDLRVLDLAAGNGACGEELSRGGVQVLVGLDNIEAARAAAERDRPGLYGEYLVEDVGRAGLVADLVARHRLNCVVCAGALAHIAAGAFGRAWNAFPPGAWLCVTLTDDLARPQRGETTIYLRDEERAGRLEVLARGPFLHRRAMDGGSIFHTSLVARRGQPPASGR